MDSARWARVRSILERAIELDGPEQEALLAEECGSDAPLRAEIESLMRFEASGSGLEPPEPAELARAFGDPNLGRRIGPYTVERVLGTGGMGVVYLARRSDADFEQRVALKLIKRGMDTEDILRQFRRERAVLAALEHQSIARLYDGGATEDGLPWFAMEHVVGRPIDVWCDEKRLSTRERIDLFVTVCAAVRHAHQRLIVHRDLKPSNILVAEDGTVKLLDFGIAKVLAAEAETAPANTRADQRRLTPDYASPEQLRGEPVSTAADVYSLGVILYELLCGANPFQGVPGTERATPAKPSTRIAGGQGARAASGARSRRELRGDLDTIVLTALAPETSQRYASVEALELDLRRHQSGLPIEARPATAAYRARKFVARNRLAVAAAGAILASLVIGLLFARAGWVEALEQGQVAEKRRLLAEKEAKRANSVLELTRDMLGSASPHDVKDKDFTLRELLDEFDARMGTESPTEPEVEASVRQIMGRAYRELGLLDKAQAHVDRALALLPGALSADDETSLALAGEWISLLHDQGEYARAETECTKIIDRLATVDGSRLTAAGFLATRGDLREHGRRLDEALVDLHAALDTYLAASPVDYHPVITCMGNLVPVYQRKGDFGEAQLVGERALGLAREHLGPRSSQTARILNNLGHMLLAAGRYAEAEVRLREAVAIERGLRDGGDHALAPSLTNLGRTLTALGKYAEAEPVLREAVELSRQGLGLKHPSLASDLTNLGALLQYKGDYAGAEPVLRESLEIRLVAFGEESVESARSLSNLGSLLDLRGKHAEAEELLRRALAVRRKLLGDRDLSIAASLTHLSGTLVAVGDLAGAEAAAREALSIAREKLASPHADLAKTLAALSAVRLAQQDLAEARALAEEALAMRRQLFGNEHPDVARGLGSLGEVLAGAGELDAAEAQLLEAEALQRKLIGAAHPHLARTLFALGELSERRGRRDEALARMREALAIGRAALGDANDETREAGRRAAALLEAGGDGAAARALRLELQLDVAAESSK